MRDKSKIMVMGGYGDVGKRVSKILSRQYPGQVIAAGRNFEKAQALSLETNRAIIPREVDFNGTWKADLFEDVKIIITCCELSTNVFAAHCFQAGIHYVDITASYQIIRQIKLCDDLAKKNGVIGIISVGLAPGISNLLVKQCISAMDFIEDAEIHLLIGLGEKHGEGSIDWMIDNVSRDYMLRVNGINRITRSFGAGKMVHFSNELGKHRTYTFNFSDQHVLQESLGIKNVITRICFSSRLVTKILSVLSILRVFRLLKYQKVKSIVKHVFKVLAIGDDKYAIKVSVRGKHNDKRLNRAMTLTGKCEAQATAEVGALTVKWIMQKDNILSGIYHIEEVISPNEIINKLKKTELYTFEGNVC